MYIYNVFIYIYIYALNSGSDLEREGGREKYVRIQSGRERNYRQRVYGFFLKKREDDGREGQNSLKKVILDGKWTGVRKQDVMSNKNYFGGLSQ